MAPKATGAVSATSATAAALIGLTPRPTSMIPQMATGVPNPASGEIDGVKFSNAEGLGKAVHDHPAVPACLVNRIYAYAVGRVPTKSETEWLNSDLKKSFAADGYRLKPLMRRIVTSDVFFRVVVPESEAKPVRSASVQGVGQ